ncbi:2-octaprenyl-6-methoxyphenol hydroxylase /2-octaprenyl-3-methyl-6-methoxy-1,4-benzoquinol hydroxylase [Luteibacter rhizovicinus]|uniref:2-octaprenyl-6-methoxyphenol hydroxylase /2-octaprenyl-3-methyl-6-methoxy-1,4-benzoquinol hydroxylase n=1 Tax=Luteibacter rhizovicinus TaxID=242606 RepID=A0A4R3YNE8_9GAMM|nr:UbiH/UbiF/VisC/COQ6 family ubiquinone biosynthesis hydroxylase [Luteibacter rhizovicinus]TCV93856.1 2-octaprenyl-6-methoxyphenol hydroxylase /2-octaprenyl-3-methyl-6-methoxy-1,4-benzoquinol hydroxylase [Luteibacter rhizovicinus]
MNASISNESSRRRGGLLDIAVVGGGMVGAATALALARAGFSTALIDVREPAPWDASAEVDLRVVGLAPSSVRLLDELGVWSAIREARASAYARMCVWDSENGATIHFDAADEGRDVLGFIVENSLVQTALWRALDEAGVRRIVPAEVSGYAMREDRAQLELADGQFVSARVVVAADGSQSPLRGMVGIGTRGRDYAQRGIVAHVRTARPHEATAWQRFLPGGPLAFLPLSDGRSSIVWSLPEVEATRVLAMDDRAFCEALGVASDFRLGPIEATTARAAFPLRLQLADRYEIGRLVLLGDAAHAVHPLAGQGVNLGFRDVTELRDVLVAARDAGSDIAASHVLRRYARRRRSADTLDALSFDALGRVYGWQAAPLVAARGMGVRLLEKTGPLKRLLGRHAAGL